MNNKNIPFLPFPNPSYGKKDQHYLFHVVSLIWKIVTIQSGISKSFYTLAKPIRVLASQLGPSIDHPNYQDAS